MMQLPPIGSPTEELFIRDAEATFPAHTSTHSSL